MGVMNTLTVRLCHPTKISGHAARRIIEATRAGATPEVPRPPARGGARHKTTGSIRENGRTTPPGAAGGVVGRRCPECDRRVHFATAQPGPVYGRFGWQAKRARIL